MIKKLSFLITLLLIPHLVWAAAATMYITPAGAGAKDGTTWATAFSEAEFEIEIETLAEPGDIYYIAGGTYTLDSAYTTALDGTVTNPIKVIGVKAGTTNQPPVYADWAYGTDRPLFTIGNLDVTFDDYWIFHNLRFTTAYITGWTVGDYSIVVNCKGYNSSTARYAFNQVGNGSQIISCEVDGQGSGGNGIVNYHYGIVASCYIHDVAVGVNLSGLGAITIDSIFDTCTTGILFNARSNLLVKGNTIYNCTTGISGATEAHNLIINNIIDTCTTGASWTTEQFSNYFDYNAWGNNTTDVTNVTKGNNDITSAPPNSYLPNAATGDFTLPAGSACLDAGMQVGTNEGAIGDYMQNIGVDGDDNVAGVGGGRGARFIIQ